MRWSTLRIWFAVVAVAYVVVVLGGITSSSLGVPRLSETRGETARGVITGTPRKIRADEYLRGTPWALGLLARGSDDFASPLAYPEVALVAPTMRDLPSALLHLEAVALGLGGLLPDEMLFAAVWWLPVALVAVLLPVWLVRLGAAPGIAVAATALVLLAPTNHWWSWGPASVLAPLLLAAVLALLGFDRWRERGANVVSIVFFGLAALCVSRSAIAYAPWAIPLSLAIFVPTLAASLASGARRLALVCLGAVFLLGVALAALLVLPSGAIDVIADTVYPGARRSVGEFVGWGLLFGAPHLWVLQASPEIASTTNESEIATGYLVLGVPSVVMAFGVRWADTGILRASSIAAGAVTSFLALWVVVGWPQAIGERAFPLTLVPPDRLAEVLGLVATITFALVLSGWASAPSRDRSRTALVAGVLAGVVTLLGGRTLRAEALPTLPPAAVALMAVLVALVVGVMVWRPAAPLALAAFPLLAALVVVTANPLQRGFGDLRSSAAAASVRETGSGLRAGTYWGSDDPAFDVLLMANGEPALSGQQWVGPRQASWRKLDPTGARRTAWNRGASFVTFWWETGSPARIGLRARDVIEIRVDPCSPALRELGLSLIASRRQLAAPCLTSRGKVAWGDSNRWLYEVTTESS